MTERTSDRAVGSLPSISHSFELDPCAVLGVEQGATLEEMRDAYREKAKKHHPDRGGDEWAFRVVARCFEILSSARVMSHAVRDASHDARGPARPGTARREPAPAEWLRPGVRDPSLDPMRTVDVEVFVVRYELSNPADLLFMPHEDMSLCCCLNIAWPSAEAGSFESTGRDASDVPRLLSEVFEEMPMRTKALSSWSSARDESFEGWLSYPTAVHAWESFRQFHETLSRRGLGVNQWTREMLVPRGGR